jgi:hypothetical protein
MIVGHEEFARTIPARVVISRKVCMAIQADTMRCTLMAGFWVQDNVVLVEEKVGRHEDCMAAQRVFRPADASSARRN